MDLMTNQSGAVTRCVQCGKEFICGAASGSCWCMGLPKVMPLPGGSESPGCFCLECLTLKQAIVDLPGVVVAYFRQAGPYGPALNAVWVQLHDWAAARGLWTKSMVAYGISQDNPMTTPPHLCRYDACIEVPAEMVIDGGAERAELPGGLYVRLAFAGKAQGLPAGFDKLFHQVIPQAEKEFDFTRPIFELYKGNSSMQSDGSFNCDLCVPVR